MAAGAEDTTRDRVLDVVRDSQWPARYPARTLRNRFTDTWQDREDDSTTPTPRPQYREGVSRGDLDYLPVWAGEAVDLIAELDSAAAVVRSHEAARPTGHRAGRGRSPMRDAC